MNKFDTIYLSWRSSRGFSRIMVGKIIQNGDNLDFTYLKENLSHAREQGFFGYPGLSIEKIEHLNVLDLFSKRLINTDRSDSKYLLEFWNIAEKDKNDRLYLLAMTQGVNQIDNFEFLADFQLNDETNFVSNVAGLSYSNFDLSKLKKGYKLQFEKENHIKDKYAVKILYNKVLIGYVKKGHNMIFHYPDSDKLQIEVKHINNSSKDKELYIKIFI